MISASPPTENATRAARILKLTVAVEERDDRADQAANLVQRDVGRLQQSSAGSSLDSGVASGESVDELATGDDARHDSVRTLCESASAFSRMRLAR